MLINDTLRCKVVRFMEDLALSSLEILSAVTDKRDFNRGMFWMV